MRKIIFLAIVIGLVFMINSELGSIYDLWQKKDLVSNAQKELEYLKEENKKLKAELSYAQTDEFIEKTARDKLLWVKEGEQLVLVPEDLIKNKDRKDKKKENKESQPNWKKWLELFL